MAVYLASRKCGTSQLHLFKHALEVRNTPGCRRIAAAQRTAASDLSNSRPKQAQATVYLLVDDFDRADAEETSESCGYQPPAFFDHSSSGVAQDNGLAPFNSAAALLSSPHTRPGRHGFLLPKRERGEKRNSICPVRPFWQYDSLICRSFGAPWMQRSELGRKIPIDPLEADAHFDECRSCP